MIDRLILVGHDCPMGEYPSVVVPVCRKGDQLVAMYSSSDGAEQEAVVNDSPAYVVHSAAVGARLRNFDARRHGLFAFSESDIRIYPIGREGDFFATLLRSPDTPAIEPFYKLSLAIETGQASLIDPCLRECVREICQERELAEAWISGISPQLSASTGSASRIRLDPPIQQNDPFPKRGEISRLWDLLVRQRSVRIAKVYPDSGLLKLLNQRYGFHFQKHRKGFYRFQWRLRSGKIAMIMPFEVAYDGSTDRALIAEELGLTKEQLSAATEGRYSIPSLQFVLLTTQLASLQARSQPTNEIRPSFLQDAVSILEEIDRDGLRDTELLGNALEKCKRLADRRELYPIGGRLLDACKQAYSG